jgi:hypothetical protein
MLRDPFGAKKLRSISRRDSAVASALGPRPPYHAARATAGTKKRKLGVGP